jgi:hypothetical protein
MLCSVSSFAVDFGDAPGEANQEAHLHHQPDLRLILSGTDGLHLLTGLIFDEADDRLSPPCDKR